MIIKKKKHEHPAIAALTNMGVVNNLMECIYEINGKKVREK